MSSIKDNLEEFRSRTIDIYDLNNFIIKLTDGKYQSFVDNEVAIIRFADGFGLILNYEAVGKKFDNPDEILKFEISEPEQEIENEDGSVTRSISMYPYGVIKLTPRNIITSADSHQELAGDFFSKCYGYNWRCADNLQDVVEILTKEGYFDTDTTILEANEESLGEKLAKCIAKAFKGECGPFGGRDPVVKGNKLILWSQADPAKYIFYDDGSCEAQFTDEDGDAYGREYDSVIDLLDESVDGWFSYFDDYPNSAGVRDEVEDLLIKNAHNTIVESFGKPSDGMSDITFDEFYNVLGTLATNLSRDEFEELISKVFPGFIGFYSDELEIDQIIADLKARNYKAVEDFALFYQDLLYWTKSDSFDYMINLYKDMIDDKGTIIIEAYEWERITKEQEEWLDKKIEEHNFKVVSKRYYGHGEKPDSVHYQILSNKKYDTLEEFQKEVDWIDELLERFEGRTGSPCTYNMGWQDDGYISCGFDCRGTSDTYKDRIIEDLKEKWYVEYHPDVGDKVKLKARFDPAFTGLNKNDGKRKPIGDYLDKIGTLTYVSSWRVCDVLFDDGTTFESIPKYNIEPAEPEPQLVSTIIESREDITDDDLTIVEDNTVILLVGDGAGARSRGLDTDTFYTFETQATSVDEALDELKEDILETVFPYGDEWEDYLEYCSDEGVTPRSFHEWFNDALDPTGGDPFLAAALINGNIEYYIDESTLDEDEFESKAAAEMFIPKWN